MVELRAERIDERTVSVRVGANGDMDDMLAELGCASADLIRQIAKHRPSDGIEARLADLLHGIVLDALSRKQSEAAN